MRAKPFFSLLACCALAFPLGCNNKPQAGGPAGTPLSGTNADRATPPGTTAGGTPRPGAAANPAPPPTTPPASPGEPIRTPNTPPPP